MQIVEWAMTRWKTENKKIIVVSRNGLPESSCNFSGRQDNLTNASIFKIERAHEQATLKKFKIFNLLALGATYLEDDVCLSELKRNLIEQAGSIASLITGKLTILSTLWFYKHDVVTGNFAESSPRILLNHKSEILKYVAYNVFDEFCLY